jgi:hypothetical protein
VPTYAIADVWSLGHVMINMILPSSIAPFHVSTRELLPDVMTSLLSRVPLDQLLLSSSGSGILAVNPLQRFSCHELYLMISLMDHERSLTTERQRVTTLTAQHQHDTQRMEVMNGETKAAKNEIVILQNKMKHEMISLTHHQLQIMTLTKIHDQKLADIHQMIQSVHTEYGLKLQHTANQLVDELKRISSQHIHSITTSSREHPPQVAPPPISTTTTTTTTTTTPAPTSATAPVTATTGASISSVVSPYYPSTSSSATTTSPTNETKSAPPKVTTTSPSTSSIVSQTTSNTSSKTAEVKHGVTILPDQLVSFVSIFLCHYLNGYFVVC